jgi:hypothetical protein
MKPNFVLPAVRTIAGRFIGDKGDLFMKACRIKAAFPQERELRNPPWRSPIAVFGLFCCSSRASALQKERTGS